MKEEDKEVISTDKEVSKESEPSTKEQLKEGVSKVVTDKVEDTTKELEELRKFKSEVEAQRKLEKEKSKEVAVSKSFFGGDEKAFREKTKSNTEKAWEELFEEGVPRRSE